ncbi:MAG: hypothetical protein DRP09_14690 [Candidatus Thorarchaeota archaeon]|nr:MAG: hypothetical protein DRP09_14690 [Candidatus Thorarchaeota archaeon]
MVEMRVYVTGKIKDMTKKEVRSIVESMGHQYTSFSQNTDILILGERPGPAKIAHALTWGVKTMTWEQFLKIEEKSERNTDTDSDYVDLYCEKKRGPSTVSVLKTAEILWLDGKGFTKIDLSNTTNLPRLTRLHLANNSLTEIDLTPLEGRNELSWLLLSNNSLGSVDLNPLATCPNLEVLELASNSIEEIDLAPLSNCEHLNTLVLSGNNLTNVNLSPLEECHRLAHLILSRNKLTSIDLFPLSGSGLRDLFLDGNHLEAIDLSPLESTYLCTLNLSKNALQDIDLSPLRSCTSLGIVDFSSNRLETFDFAPFAHLQYLWHVVLCNNRIGRIDLSPVFEVWSNGYPQPSVYIDRNSLDRFGKPALFYDDENDRGRVLLEIDDDVAVAMDSVYREELEVQQDKGFSEIRSRITLISGADLAREVDGRD